MVAKAHRHHLLEAVAGAADSAAAAAGRLSGAWHIGLVESGQLQCSLDDIREVLGGDVRHAAQAGLVGGEQVLLVAGHGLQHAVSGDKDGAGEVTEVHLLAVPGTSVVACQVRVLLESGVAMRRQHLPVCVHVDALALGLLQQLLQVMHVVTRHQDALAGLGGEGHLRGRGVAERGGVRLTQHLHHAEVALAQLHGHVHDVGHLCGRGAAEEAQRLLHKGVDCRVPSPQGLCVCCVGAQPL
mmetsp:Transcript_27180/g.59339  ORF Transcript_27180/g.59339 Transcript_27180/m.59339 type:complete len:241 (-) Transcript_27180:871-1593(-)